MIYQCCVCMLTCYKLRGALLASCFLFFWGWWYFWTRPLHPRPRLLRSPFTVKPLPHSLPFPSVKVNLCDSVCLDGDCGLSGMLSLYGWRKNSTNDDVKEKETKKRNKKKISKDFKELKHWENAEWKLFLCFFGFCQKLVRKRAIQHESSAKALHKTQWHIQEHFMKNIHFCSFPPRTAWNKKQEELEKSVWFSTWRVYSICGVEIWEIEKGKTHF